MAIVAVGSGVSSSSGVGDVCIKTTPMSRITTSSPATGAIGFLRRNSKNFSMKTP
jgi:hypothetical protein